MNSVRKAIISVAIVIALVVIAWLWNSSVGDSPAKIEINTTKAPVTEQVIAQTTVPQTTNPPTELTFNNVNEAKKYVEEYAKKKGYDLKAYPEKLFELMVKDKSSIDFVLDYPAEIEKEHPFKLEIDNFDEVPLLIQWDTRWGYHQFKNGVVGIDGCGATCVSMSAIYLTHDLSLTPDVIADYAADNGYFVNGSGISWSMYDKGIGHFGLKSKGVSMSENALKNAVEKGHPVILSVKEGDFTRKGHYILAVGYKDGEFKINDPFSVVNSEKRWTWERLKPQIKNMWEIYI